MCVHSRWAPDRCPRLSPVMGAAACIHLQVCVRMPVGSSPGCRPGSGVAGSRWGLCAELCEELQTVFWFSHCSMAPTFSWLCECLSSTLSPAFRPGKPKVLTTEPPQEKAADHSPQKCLGLPFSCPRCNACLCMHGLLSCHHAVGQEGTAARPSPFTGDLQPRRVFRAPRGPLSQQERGRDSPHLRSQTVLLFPLLVPSLQSMTPAT